MAGALRASLALACLMAAVATAETVLARHDSTDVHQCNYDEVQARTLHLTGGVRRGRQLYDDRAADGSGRRRRAQDLEWEPLRVTYDTSFLADSVLDDDTRTFVEETLLPDAAAFWLNSLSTVRVVGNLTAEMPCTSVWPSDGECATLADEFVCGPDPESSPHVPDWLVGPQRVCTDLGGGSRDCHDTTAGPGEANSDHIALVTAVQTSLCGDGAGVVAYAAWCQLDQLDRPTISHINFCPSALSTAPAAYSKQLAVAKHEIAHALGFSGFSISLFRDENGDPRTPREPDALSPYMIHEDHRLNVGCPGEGVRVNEMPSAATVAFSSERGHSDCNPSTPSPGACVQKIVTPRVVAVARKWFDCDTLDGPELEDRPADECGVVSSHWEQRTHMDALMASTVGHAARVTPMTLAFFEDSGWYRGNYQNLLPAVKGLQFGAFQGCDFAEEPCIADGVAQGAPEHYCAEAQVDTCTVDRAAAATCQVGVYGLALPVANQYFDDPTHGGMLPDADYCPFKQAYDNRVCGNADHRPDTNVMGETYGDDSMCQTARLTWAGWSSAEILSGCFLTQCISATSLQVLFEKEDGSHSALVCDEDDAGTVATPDGFTGWFECPDPALICGAGVVVTPDTELAAPPAQYADLFNDGGGGGGGSGDGSGGSGDGSGEGSGEEEEGDPNRLAAGFRDDTAKILGVDQETMSIIFYAAGFALFLCIVACCCYKFREKKEEARVVPAAQHAGAAMGPGP